MYAARTALFIQEILELILEELSPGPWIPNPRQCQGRVFLELLRSERHKRQAALACFARVCRALSDPVLEVLWRYVDDVSYLLCGVQSCYRIEGFQWRVSFVVVPLLGPHRLIRYSECLQHIHGRTRSN